ncbi:MAG: beta-lactamase family protein [Clostridiales bacterium]|nr:beta-lactamase family protein [Clostridiales bacterium]
MNLEKFIEHATPRRVLAVVVSQNGQEIGRHLWEPICRRNVYSATKTFTCTAVGLAVKEGLLSLDEKLTDAFAEDLPESVDENLQKATVNDLLTMCLGQAEGHLMGKDRVWVKEDDWVKYALSFPFAYEPGTHFVYNNVGPYLAGILVQRRAGCNMMEYLYPRLFKPLGIKRTVCEIDPLGNTFGAGGLLISIDELHRLGLLYLQRGNWEGKQILTEEWVDDCLTKQSENDGHDPFGYGRLIWGEDKGGWRISGKYGQMSMIFREKNAVITVVSECREGDALRKCILDDIYSQL